MKKRILSAAFTLLVISATLASAQGLTLRTGDGLVLELSAAGEVTAAQIGAAKLPLAGTGGFSIADFHDHPAQPLLLSFSPLPAGEGPGVRVPLPFGATVLSVKC